MYRPLLILIAFSITLPTRAHQPVMDMAPRWSNGFGFQVRHEFYGSDTLMDGNSEIDNPLKLERYVRRTSFEGVYTFDRAKRVTFKIPYVEQDRIKNVGGKGIKQRNTGYGDLVLGVPLKRYRNMKANTSNFGVTPSIRIPTGNSSGNFPISDGSWDVGLSVAYSAEGFPLEAFQRLNLYQMYDLFYWHNSKGTNGNHEGDEFGLDINVGFKPYHNDNTNTGLFIMWDVTARYNGEPGARTLTTASGGQRIQTGPILVLYKDNIMFRSEYKYPVYENSSNVSNSRGHEINIGIGITF